MNDNFPFSHFINFDNGNKSNTLAKSFNPGFLDNGLKSDLVDSQIAPIEPEQDFEADELKSITEEVKKALSHSISPQKYSAFLEHTFTIKSIGSDKVDVVVTTPFIKNMISNHFIDNFKQAFRELLGKEYDISIGILAATNESLNKPTFNINIENDEETSIFDRPKESKEKKTTVKNSTFRLDTFTPTQDGLMDEVQSKYLNHMNKGFGQKVDLNKTFDNFVVGQSNTMAQALAYSVAMDPGKVYPQFYLYGNSGLGKTHLLHAICNKINETKPNLRICITTANAFMSEMILAIQNKTDGDFRRKYTECVDVLIIDDIQELKDKVRTQTEFFHIFNELQSKGKQLIFTSDKPPKEIGGIEDRIRTRLSSALLVEIHQPDLETRIAILKKKAIESDIFLDDDVVNFIASRIKSNIRELEGLLIKLGAYSHLMKVDIDLETAKQQLGLTGEFEQKAVTIELIADSVAGHFKVAIGDLRGKSRLKDITFARHIAMYMSHKITRATLEEIGDFYGKRDHTSVIHGIKKIERILKEDSKLAQKLYEIETSLNQ